MRALIFVCVKTQIPTGDVSIVSHRRISGRHAWSSGIIPPLNHPAHIIRSGRTNQRIHGRTKLTEKPDARLSSSADSLSATKRENTMYADRFENRLAIVRHRFATTLESKITEVVISTDRMSRNKDGGIKDLSESYRRLHSICGIGPTVGFGTTGEAARTAEGILLQAYRGSRGLTEAEVLNLKKALGHLRAAAASELRLMYQRGG
jgi:hypothetical protein